MYITIAEAARLRRCNRRTITNAIRDGRLTDHGSPYAPRLDAEEVASFTIYPANDQRGKGVPGRPVHTGKPD
jgi:hypothetical protein